MFNDYRKLNKLWLFTILIVFIIFIIAEGVFFYYFQKPLTGKRNQAETVSLIINISFNIGMYSFLGFVCGSFFIAIKSFWGKSRNLMMTYRNRTYYLQMQLLMITISALVSTGMFAVWKVGFNYLGGYYNTGYNIPLNFEVNTYLLALSIIFFTLYMLFYYFIMYIIDIFANTDGRYKSILNRNLRVFGFIVRCFAILILTVYLNSSIFYFIDTYNQPADSLIYIELDYEWTMIASFSLIMILLIVEYMSYFKKKVIV